MPPTRRVPGRGGAVGLRRPFGRSRRRSVAPAAASPAAVPAARHTALAAAACRRHPQRLPPPAVRRCRTTSGCPSRRRCPRCRRRRPCAGRPAAPPLPTAPVPPAAVPPRGVPRACPAADSGAPAACRRASLTTRRLAAAAAPHRRLTRHTACRLPPCPPRRFACRLALSPLAASRPRRYPYAVALRHAAPPLAATSPCLPPCRALLPFSPRPSRSHRRPPLPRRLPAAPISLVAVSPVSRLSPPRRIACPHAPRLSASLAAAAATLPRSLLPLSHLPYRLSPYRLFSAPPCRLSPLLCRLSPRLLSLTTHHFSLASCPASPSHLVDTACRRAAVFRTARFPPSPPPLPPSPSLILMPTRRHAARPASPPPRRCCLPSCRCAPAILASPQPRLTTVPSPRLVAVAGTLHYRQLHRCRRSVICNAGRRPRRASLPDTTFQAPDR